ncbi:MAG TPA: response regulator [Burkholderiaceae bacterium]|jgi:two-component system response regulator QseB|nr:response regulator [Burkholderiaceae bacterium]
MRLLLVEDDTMIGRALVRGLTQVGFSVDWVTDGASGLSALSQHVHDLVLLDIGLPRMDGLSLLKCVRASQNDTLVLVISARDGVPERIAGLNAGADDYLLKPFDLDELIARVRALLRRRTGSATGVLVAGSLTLDPSRRTVLQGAREVSLTAKEFALLETLMQKPGAVVSRERLEQSIYGWVDEPASNTLEVHLHYLRRKLGADLIRNVRGVGYRLDV